MIIVHDQTSGGQAVFTGLADVRDGFTYLFARLSVASGLTELAAFGSQDVDRVLLDDTEDSVIIVYDQTLGGRAVFAGLAGARDCFAGLFVWSVDSMIIVQDLTSGGQTVFAGLAGVRDCFTGLFACSVDSVFIVHDQTAGGQTVFTGLAGVHDCFTP